MALQELSRHFLQRTCNRTLNVTCPSSKKQFNLDISSIQTESDASRDEVQSNSPPVEKLIELSTYIQCPECHIRVDVGYKTIMIIDYKNSTLCVCGHHMEANDSSPSFRENEDMTFDLNVEIEQQFVCQNCHSVRRNKRRVIGYSFPLERSAGDSHTVILQMTEEEI